MSMCVRAHAIVRACFRHDVCRSRAKERATVVAWLCVSTIYRSSRNELCTAIPLLKLRLGHKSWQNLRRRTAVTGGQHDKVLAQFVRTNGAYNHLSGLTARITSHVLCPPKPTVDQ